MDCYNLQYVGKKQMSFANIELDHIKPVQSFALDLNHYSNLQPLLKEINGQKSSKWTETDETFWKINVEHQPKFTDIYTGNSISESDYTPPHLQPKQLD